MLTGLLVFVLFVLIPAAFCFWFGWALISFVIAPSFGQACKYFLHSVASIVLAMLYEIYVASPLLQKLS